MGDFFASIGNWFVENYITIIKTFGIIIIGFLFIKIILAILKRQFKKTKMEKVVQSFVLSILKFVLYLILILAVFSTLGISITGLTVVISAISLAITLALQDSLKNLVNGFIIISTKLVHEGDWVKIGDYEGSIQDVRMLYTVLKTADNKRITIPNSTIIGSQITNFNYYKTRRIDLNFDVSYDTNVDLAKDVINSVIESCETIFMDPKPSVVLSSLNNSSITFTLKIWCNSSDYWDTKWYLIDNIFNELKRNNITIPFNQLEVALVDPNKKNYVREQKLTPAENHKTKTSHSEDIIDKISHTIKKPRKAKKQSEKKDSK